MTLLELYEQFCRNYKRKDSAALLRLLEDNAELLSTATPDLILLVEDNKYLFSSFLALKAILCGDIDFLSKTKPLFSPLDEQIISALLSVETIKTLLPWVIRESTEKILSILLQQLLLKTQGNFNLDEPLVDGLTALELLSQSDKRPHTIFTKRMMLFYAAAWDYFVGEQPPAENMHNLPYFFSLTQPVKNIGKFLNLQTEKADDNPFFDKKGLCVGLCYLHDLYAAEGRLDYYFMTIALLNIWDGSAEQLNKPLPAIFPQTFFYETLGELFQQWTNDILLFQGLNVDAHILNPEVFALKQYAGRQFSYFSLVRPKTAANTKLVFIENQNKDDEVMNVSDERIEEYLHYFIQMPNIFIHIVKNGHETSIRTLEGEGQLSYFNPNEKIILLYFPSLSDLMPRIRKAHSKHENYAEEQYLTIYHYEGPMYQKPWAQKSIFAAEDLPRTAAEARAFQQHSPNRFTPLHIAVLVQDAATIKAILATEAVDMEADDCYGRSAIDIAIENSYWEGAALLLDDSRMQHYNFYGAIMHKCIKHEQGDFIVRFMQHKKVEIALREVLKMSMHYNGTKIIEDIKQVFLEDCKGKRAFLLKMVETLFECQKEELAKELFLFMAQNLEKKDLDDVLNGVIDTIHDWDSSDSEGESEERATLLHQVILVGNYGFAQFLIERGADLNMPIQGGYYDSKTARQLLEERGQLELIPEEYKSPAQASEERFSFFSTTARRAGDRLQEKMRAFSSTFHF